MEVSTATSQSDRHNRPDWLWQSLTISILIFPLFPALGAAGLLLVAIKSGQRNWTKIRSSRLNGAIAILALLLLTSSAVAEQPQEAWLGLANFLPFFWLFVSLRSLIKYPAQLKQLAWLLVIPSLPIVILGFGQLYVGWSSPTLVDTILGWQLVPQGVPTGRMSSVFIYTNFLAIYLAISFSLALGLWLDTWQAWRRNSHQQAGILLLLTLTLLADLGGLVFTSSRNAWGLAVIAFMAYAVYLGWRWLVYGVIAAATTILWASFAPNLGGTQLRTIVPAFFWARLSDQLYERPVETLRITQWQFCLDLIQTKPWLGWGLRNFTPLYEARMNYWFGHPHNLFLMLGAETGIAAVLLLAAVVGSIIFQGTILLKQLTNGSKLILFSYLVAFSSCVLFNLLDVTIFDLRINTIAWILLSAISGVVVREKSLTTKF